MPYCPKCDMEFVDGITACSDCGGPLVESKEVADAMKRAQREQEEKARAAWLAEAVRMADAEAHGEDAVDAAEGEYGETGYEAGGGDPCGSGGYGGEAGEAGLPGEAGAGGASLAGGTMKKAARTESRVYVTKRQRMEDMRSSVFAFLLVGAVFVIAGILYIAGVIRLPLASGTDLIFKVVLTGLGIACLVVAFTTRNSSKKMEKEADAEDARTGELLRWFTSSYTGEELDEVLLREDPSLSGSELELKRFELISDRLITHEDLPDASYVDALSEEIYGKLYE